jgi:DNA recombination protein RmuC
VDGGLDFVIMFVPIEGALAAALAHQPELAAMAAENRVAIATPTTLMIALRTVWNVWQIERRNSNAEAIAKRAGDIYRKMVSFCKDMVEVGNRLNQARACHEDAMRKLSTGRENLVLQVERLKRMGAKTTKSLPADLLAASGAQDEALAEPHPPEPDQEEEARTAFSAVASGE